MLLDDINGLIDGYTKEATRLEELYRQEEHDEKFSQYNGQITTLDVVTRGLIGLATDCQFLSEDQITVRLQVFTMELQKCIDLNRFHCIDYPKPWVSEREKSKAVAKIEKYQKCINMIGSLLPKEVVSA